MSVRLRPRVLALLVVAATAALSSTALMSQAATPAGLDPSTRPTPAADGRVLSGLMRERTGPCAGAYRVPSARVLDRPLCSHGPDSYAGFTAAEARSTTTRTGGRKTAPTPTTTTSPTSTPTTAPTGARCGTDGPRVQALYVHAADVPDRFASLLPSMQQWLVNADGVFATSAAETGGTRHIRFLTDGACSPVITDVQVSSVGDDDLSSTITELQAQGFSRTDRKYLLWVDANTHCGIGTVQGDDTTGATNRNNTGPSYGRTDAGCWGGYTEAHELMHNLGGVQMSAPHSNGGWHCSDEYDLMCYQENSKAMTYPCPLEHDNVFDCGHDDYFSTAPQQGSYLATHWNSADSAYLTSAS